jgi:hypothetical protein
VNQAEVGWLLHAFVCAFLFAGSVLTARLTSSLSTRSFHSRVIISGDEVNKEEAKTQLFLSLKDTSNDRGVFVDPPSAITDLLVSKRRSPRIDDDSSDDGDLFCSADKENEMPPSAASVVSVSNPYTRKKAPPTAASSAASSGAVLAVPATSTTSNPLLVDKNNAGEISMLISSVYGYVQGSRLHR